MPKITVSLILSKIEDHKIHILLHSLCLQSFKDFQVHVFVEKDDKEKMQRLASRFALDYALDIKVFEARKDAYNQALAEANTEWFLPLQPTHSNTHYHPFWLTSNIVDSDWDIVNTSGRSWASKTEVARAIPFRVGSDQFLEAAHSPSSGFRCET